MNISDAGIFFIKQHEGLRLDAYRDIAGVWTIGYGHTKGFKDGRLHENTTISEDQAEDLLREDLRGFVTALNTLAQAKINQNQFDALVSLMFNIGQGAFERSTALTRLNAGDFAGAADAMTWWNKARVNGVLRVVKGLQARRLAEKELFLKPIHTGPPLTSIESCAVDEPGGCAEKKSCFGMFS